MEDQQHAGVDTDRVNQQDRKWSRSWFWTVVVLMLVVLVGGWWVLAGQAARSVAAEKLEVVCDQGRTQHVGLDSDGHPAANVRHVAVTIPSVALSRGLDCRLEVSVRNGSARTVTLTRIVFPFFGEASAMGPLAGELRGVDARRLREDPREIETLTDRDATWLVDRQLDPGEVVQLTLDFGLNPNACMSTGTTATLHSIPHLTTQVLGRHIDWPPAQASQSPDPPALRFEGTSDASCDPE